MTNMPANTSGSGLQLRRIGVGLTHTNLMLYTWGQCSFLKLPLKFVVQRGFRIEQNGTNDWQMPLESFKVGEVEVPRRYWDSATAFFKPLDQPALDCFPWRTNVPALLVRKNEVSERPELRLYTYKPIPAEDLR
jgi:hypothetical protein